MKRIGLIASASLVGVATLLYLGDWSVLRLRSKPYDSITVEHYYAIPQKTGRVELQYDRTYSQQCARSLLSHAGFQPCWYLRRHTQQWTRI